MNSNTAVNEARDMPLPPGEHMHVQDTTKGTVKVYTGPTVVNQTGQEQPVTYDAHRRQFETTDLAGARQKNVFVPEDSYCMLQNPAFNTAGDMAFPEVGACSNMVPLNHGECVNIPGPATFAMWPEQSANVIEGHRLRSNQYLLVEVVNGIKAQDNWQQATVETAEGEDTSAAVADRITFRTGELIIIKGTEAGFFIPCTGVRVVPDGRTYVRDAMTLEQLEFCILVGEDGVKLYPRGPKVVFPEPTEMFWTDAAGNKKFRAYELSKISALYIKVIAPYKEDDMEFAAGEELFITGAGSPIYYPRPEHSIVKYGDSAMHHATAIPKGEGRYVLDRLTGKIVTEVGEKMLLPDARTRVIVRRVLTQRECDLWFPGNQKAAQHNEKLRATAADTPSNFVDTVSFNAELSSEALDYGSARSTRRMKGGPPAHADEMRRGTSYAPPRSITLDTKMDGAVGIQVWTGFAAMVVGKDGRRKPVIGPDTVLLDYDQTLEVLRLSTKKPKDTNDLYETVYLNTTNNKVSDIVNVHTRDQVEVDIKLSFHVDFEGDAEKWFNVENYVKLLCDRVRSILKGVIRNVDIETLFADHVTLIRDTILGVHSTSEDAASDGRPGMLFKANGMRVIDVDVLGFDIPDRQVKDELIVAQRQALTTSLRLQNKRRDVEAQERAEALDRQLATARAETETARTELSLRAVAERESLSVREQEKKQAEHAAAHDVMLVEEHTFDVESEHEIARARAVHEEELEFKTRQQAIRLNGVEKETEAVKVRLTAASDKLVASLQGNIQANAMDTFSRHGMQLGALTGTPVNDFLRRTLGTGLGGMIVNAAEGFLDNGGVEAPLQEDLT